MGGEIAVGCDRGGRHARRHTFDTKKTHGRNCQAGDGPRSGQRAQHTAGRTPTPRTQHTPTKSPRPPVSRHTHLRLNQSTRNEPLRSQRTAHAARRLPGRRRSSGPSLHLLGWISRRRKVRSLILSLLTVVVFLCTANRNGRAPCTLVLLLLSVVLCVHPE